MWPFGQINRQPESALKWLQDYLPAVKVIYALQLLSGTDVDDGWTPLNSLRNAWWDHAGGILQADGEGFNNEKRFRILWQFPENACGPWAMGSFAGWQMGPLRNGPG